jgi:hypothetical protein
LAPIDESIALSVVYNQEGVPEPRHLQKNYIYSRRHGRDVRRYLMIAVAREERLHVRQQRLKQSDVGGVVGGLFKSLSKET